jgi:glycosyltransferase involved in cell wall biosynthesis
VRILVLTNKPPLPKLLTGGGQRTDLLLRALERCGEVDLLLVTQPKLCTARELEPVRERYRLVGRHEWTRQLWAGCWRFPAGWLPGLAGRASEALATQTRRSSPEHGLARQVRARWHQGGYDVVIGRPLEPVLRSGVLKAPARVIVDGDDLDSEVLRQRLAAPDREQSLPRWIEASLVRRLRRIELRAFDRCDHVWLASEEDHDRLALPQSSVLPNVPWTAEGWPPIVARPPRRESRVVLFVGDLRYEPNAEGVDHFVRRVWPRVGAAVPGALLRLVGHPPPPGVQLRWRAVPGVEIAGFQDELEGVYDNAALTVAPITWGGGTNIKVVESLAYARTCVVTSRVLAGFKFLRHGESVWCADDVAAMADGCIRLLRDPAMRSAMAERGRRLVEERASIPCFELIVRRTLQAVVGASR